MMIKTKFLIIISFLFFLVTPVYAQETATDSSDNEIREKVQEKVDKVLNTPYFYMGTITDISEGTIQIDEHLLNGNQESSEILLIATDYDTGYVKILKTASNIDFEEVAIGDFIIAMGYKNGQDVIEAKRILVTNKIEASKRTSFKLLVNSVEVNSFQGTSQKGEEIEIQISKNTDIFSSDNENIDLTDLNENDLIIVSTTLDDEGEYFARTIKAISQDGGSDSEEEVLED